MSCCFDTATQVALLVLAEGTRRSRCLVRVSWSGRAVFRGGMSLVDALAGIFMSRA